MTQPDSITSVVTSILQHKTITTPQQLLMMLKICWWW